MKKKLILFGFILLVLIFFVYSAASALPAEIDNGVGYLTENQNPDGSWGDDTTSTEIAFTSTAIIETFSALGLYANQSYIAAIQWLYGQSFETTAEISMRIFTGGPGAQDLEQLISYLDIYSAAWGGCESYGNNHLDTALALYALKKAGNDLSDDILFIIGRSIHYLKEQQNNDGGWGLTGDDDSDVYVTAIVLRAIAQNHNYQLQTCINDGVQFLLNHQQSDGGFGTGTASTVFETAYSYFALLESDADILGTAKSVQNYLLSNQATNGSWNDDVYETALAIRALYLVQPNLTATAADVVFAPSMPQAGQSIDINVTVHNKGYDTSGDFVVRVFDGDPSSGGVQIGSDVSVVDRPAGKSTVVTLNTSFASTGARNLFVQLDPDNVVDEIDETDNDLSTRLWVATGPDLAVVSGDLVPDTYAPVPGEAFVLQYMIRNIGEADVAGFTAGIYDGDPAGSGALLQSINLSGLAGASSRTGTVGVTLNSGGSHTLFLVVDPTGQIAESSESNNRTSVTVQVGGETGGADLVIGSGDIKITPGRPAAGDIVTIEMQYHNYGTQAAQGATVELYNGDPSAGGALLDAMTVNVDPGQSGTMTSTWSVPAGRHRLYAVLDRSNAILETNESNNIAVASVMTDMVDIVLSSSDLTFSPEYPVDGDAVSLGIKVRNTGVSATGPFNVALYDGSPTSGGVLLQTFIVDTIAGDAQRNLVHTFTAEARTYQFYAVADQENQIAEFSEENNAAMRSMIIKGPGETYGPDLIPLKISISGDTVTDAHTLQTAGTVHVTFQNMGDEKIETPFTVLVFEDTDLDGTYTPGVDTDLGRIENDHPLWPNGGFGVDVPIAGQVSFLKAPLSALIDADDLIAEQKEDNNTITSGSDCEVRPVNPIEAVVEWRLTVPINNGISQPPAIINLTDDNNDGRINSQDIPDIVYTYYNGFLTAVHGNSGENIFTNTDRRTGSHAFTAAGDINNDGLPEIVTTKWPQGGGTEPYSHFPALVAFAHDGTLLWDNAADIYYWNQDNPQRRVTLNNASVMTIADIDADGQAEIIVGGTCINADGSIRWVRLPDSPYKGEGNLIGNWGRGSLVVDLDMDGTSEIVGGNIAYEHDGTVHWFNDTLRDGLNAIGNLDDDPYPEIALITSASQVPHPPNGRLYLLEHDGSVKWGPIYLEDLPGVNYTTGGHGGAPVIADFDGDGEAEVGTKSLDYYFTFDKNGNLKNQYYIPYQSDGFYSAPTVFDLNGDGRPEVLIHSDRYFRIFDGPSGDLLFEDSYGASFNSSMNVLIADVDGDNQAEAVVIGSNHLSHNDDLRVYGSANSDWINARRVWSGLHYHADNITDDGGIPKHEEPSWLTHNTYRCQLPVGDYANPYLTANLTASYLRMAAGADGVTLTVRVGNGGAAVADANTAVEVYLGDAGTGTVLGTAATTRPLAPGQYQDISIIYNGTVSDGDLITAMVDPSDTVAECNEQDNVLQSHYSEPVGVADLKIGSEDIALPADPIAEGAIATVTATVHNLGSADAAAISAQLYNGHPASGGTALSGVRTIAAIGAGTSEPVSFTIDTLGFAGTTMCYVVIDGADQIAEQSEDNNMAVFALATVAPSLPNLVVGAADIQINPADAQPGQSVTIAATIHNRGATTAGIPVRFYLDDPDQGGRQIFGQTIFADLAHGASTTLRTSLNTTNLGGQNHIHVVVDPLNIIAESNEQDNRADSALFVQSAGLTAQAATDKSNYSSGEDVLVNWSVTDSSGAARQLTADIFILDAAGNVMATVADSQGVTVGADGTVSQTHSWNTGRALNGSYTVVIELHEGLYKVARASTGFGIAEDKTLQLQVACDRIAYEANQPVVISATAISQSVNAIFEDLRAQVQILAPDQSQLYSSDQTIATLMPEALVRFTRNWNSSVHPAGQYTVVLSVYEDQLQLASTQASFAIHASSAGGQGLAGSLTVAPALVQRGAPIALTSRIENRGNADINAATMRISIVEPQSQSLIEDIDTSADLAMGAVVARQHSYATMGLEPGIYLAILQVNADGFAAPRTIASARFEVEPGDVIDADVVPADPVNLLVWVNDRCRRDDAGERDDDHGRHGHRCDDDDDRSRRGHGKERCPQHSCADTDRIAALLVETVDDYRIVTSPEAFSAELRNPYHTDILILGDHHSLDRHTQDELREKVFSGTGLIASKYHEPSMFKHEAGHRHGAGSILGVSEYGTLPDRNRQVEFVPSELGIEGTMDISSSIMAVEPADTATVAGWLPANLPGKHTQKACGRHRKYPALVLHRYGKGKTVFCSFDLGVNLTASAQEKTKELVAQSIAFVHMPAEVQALYPFALQPIAVELKSTGTAADLQIEHELPQAFRLYDPVSDQWSQSPLWTTQLSVAADQTKTLLAYVLAPNQSGPAAMTTRVSVLMGGNPNLLLELDTPLDIPVDLQGMVDATIEALGSIDQDSHGHSKAKKTIKLLERLNTDANMGWKSLKKNIHHLLKAVHYASMIDHEDAPAIRHRLDRLLSINTSIYYYRYRE